eukprot:6214107-Pleurochrysis_carterae.AAC.2
MHGGCAWTGTTTTSGYSALCTKKMCTSIQLSGDLRFERAKNAARAAPVVGASMPWQQGGLVSWHRDILSAAGHARKVPVTFSREPTPDCDDART